ncbi:spirocyclase AveC family protein [Gordonia amicalis]|uniref:Spirocyclase AveC family protein n=1 Tax=Gordonia amicalis TaxID=89053 RepID=A0AAE4R2Z8_9ACTN|nr:spirocyclase AveC family protein [Gordonia amicalis]MCZ4578627.1 spirocyclase AveC family protein [Gordonia amicalis]MDV6311466.1 spirocyclase AveC family protein [Gordonia amicalis]
MSSSLGEKPDSGAVGQTSPDDPVAAPVAKESPPIVWLARLGAVFVAIQAYVYIRWIFSDSFTPIPTGPDDVPTHTLVIIRASEVICVVGVIASIIWLVRRTRRDGQFPTIGVFMMGWLLTCWQDVGVNAVVPVFSYNSAFLNMGTWGEFVPGWVSKGPETPAPILYELADYMLFLPLAVVGIDKAVKAARARWPRLNKAGIIAALLLIFLVLDTMSEQILQRQGLWSYLRVNETWSIFTGTLNQFPLYEGIVFGSVVMVASMCFYLFRRDGDRLITDAGIERLKITRGVAVVRILAFSAVMNVILAVFFLGFNLVNMHADVAPTDVPSYLHQNMCGLAENPPCPHLE